MKKTYLHIYIVAILFVATFIIGSFFDYQISDALYREKDTFGLVISVIGTAPGYGILAFLGGGCLYLGLKKEFPHVAWRVVTFIAAAAGAFCSIFFLGREFFGPNGFYFLGIEKFWGYFIAFPACVGFGVLGYWLTSKSDYNKLWAVYLLLALAILIALVPGTTLIKSIFHRPRFRSLGLVSGLDFHNWWVPCSNYEELIASDATHTLISEEFKSFPSGHASTCSVFMMSTLFLSYLNNKWEKISFICFFVGLAWGLLVSYSRILVGAHFLSDVSMGQLLSIIFIFATKVVVDNHKYFEQLVPQIENE